MIVEVTMYKLRCDEPECGRYAEDDADYFAWADVDQAVEQALYDDWWISDDHKTARCSTHAPSWCEECDDRHVGPCPEAAKP